MSTDSEKRRSFVGPPFTADDGDPSDGMVETIAVNAALLLLPWAIFAALFLIAFNVATGWGGPDVAGRLFPFANAHLLEEAVQGPYRPLPDAVCMGFSIIVALPAFGVPAACATRYRRNGARIASVSVLGAGLVLVLWRYWNFASGYPWAVRSASLAQVGIWVLFGVSAIALSRRYSHSWHAV